MTRRGSALAIATTHCGGGNAGAAASCGLLPSSKGCAKLKDEQAALEQAGVRGSMAKGPEWAKGNLSPDKLEQVRRLIEVDEQLTFRCHGKPLVQLPPEIEADPAAIPPGTDGKDAPGKAAVKKKGAVKKAAARPADKAGQEAGKQEPAVRRAAPAKAAAAKANAEKAAQPPGGAPAKAKPKPKANDAYRPTPGDPTGNPFAGQTK